MSEVHIARLCVIGVGLIGGSFAQALRQAGVVDEIVGCGRSTENLDRARDLGVIDRYCLQPAEAVQGADVVLLAMPVSATAPVYIALEPGLSESAIVTDVGSTKGSVIADLHQALGGLPARFVPAHPIAGTENSGVDAAFAELFRQRRVILTPEDQTDRQAVAKVKALWEAVGATVVEMQAAHHDEVLAATSHLPHLLAYSLVDTLAGMEERGEIFSYAAGGFRDFTRIASSDPQMWADIVFANRDALLPVLERFLVHIDALKQAIARDDREAVVQVFDRAKRERDRFASLVGQFVQPGDME